MHVLEQLHEQELLVATIGSWCNDDSFEQLPASGVVDAEETQARVDELDDRRRQRQPWRRAKTRVKQRQQKLVQDVALQKERMR